MRILNSGLVRAAAVALGVFGWGAVLVAAEAATVGVAVDDFTATNTQVGETEIRPLLGGVEAIKYYIPLSSENSGVYGVTSLSGGLAGTFSDSGFGGGTLTMNLEFTPVSETLASVLVIEFEDLDLAGVNDPAAFFESLQVFDSGGNALTGLITDIGSFVSGNGDTQQFALGLGVLSSTSFFAQLLFSSTLDFYGTNTPEYLYAQVFAMDNFTPLSTLIMAPTLIPEPATLALFGFGLAGLGFMRRRRTA